MEQQQFINSIKDGAIACMKKYKILASLTIAQAIQESGGGTSQLAVEANNLFGIKRWGYPDYVTLPTTEYTNGQETTVNADFRKYGSWTDSINDHAAFLLENSRYSNLVGCTDYNQACVLISQDGYATDPNYTNSLLQIIKEYDLQQYDILPQENTQIEELQGLLNKLGYRDKNGNVLVVDGSPGPLTKSAAGKAVLTRGCTGNLVKWLQNKLISLGFSCGPCGVDGSFGYATQLAVQRFQAKYGLVPDGSVGPLTWAMLLSL